MRLTPFAANSLKVTGIYWEGVRTWWTYLQDWTDVCCQSIGATLELWPLPFIIGNFTLYFQSVPLKKKNDERYIKISMVDRK